MGLDGTRGILNPAEGFTRFALSRESPPEDLAPFVDRYWSVRWDLEGQPPYEQETLPYPCVHISFTTVDFEVHGPGTRRFVAHLSGRGQVHGTKFKPAGFFALAKVPMRALVDRVVSLEHATGRAAPIPENAEPATVKPIVESFLRSFEPIHDATAELVNGLVARAQEDRQIARAEDLAQIAGVSVRSLHRLFERYVGVGPKWIVRRSRVQEAADRVARGGHVDWAAVAQELGYHDQAHLIRDFRAQIGFTPSIYARRCKEAAARASSSG
ncbi:helix-turn-helix domain-containing protein [Pendulispora brunnea]|uniref:Helix-turn-helix domain-containing protein n=1 Tax=Pendulispora brunnea TaxID=2905690 RepID=A0ABZ2K673_9BACT